MAQRTNMIVGEKVRHQEHFLLHFNALLESIICKFHNEEP